MKSTVRKHVEVKRECRHRGNSRPVDNMATKDKEVSRDALTRAKVRSSQRAVEETHLLR